MVVRIVSQSKYKRSGIIYWTIRLIGRYKEDFNHKDQQINDKYIYCDMNNSTVSHSLFVHFSQLSTVEMVFLAVLNIVITLINIALNSFTCYIIVKRRMLNKTLLKLIFTISISDLCIAIVAQNLHTYQLFILIYFRWWGGPTTH